MINEKIFENKEEVIKRFEEIRKSLELQLAQTQQKIMEVDLIIFSVSCAHCKKDDVEPKNV